MGNLTKKLRDQAGLLLFGHFFRKCTPTGMGDASSGRTDMTYEFEGGVAVLEPEVKRQESQITRLRRQSPRTWPEKDVNLVEWRTDTIRQILQPDFTPVGASLAPSLFIALITEACTEVRLGVSNAEVEWDASEPSDEIESRLDALARAVAAAIDFTKNLRSGSAPEDELRDLYIMHMEARHSLLLIMLNGAIDLDERRKQKATARASIRVTEMEKARRLPELFERIAAVVG